MSAVKFDPKFEAELHEAIGKVFLLLVREVENIDEGLRDGWYLTELEGIAARALNIIAAGVSPGGGLGMWTHIEPNLRSQFLEHVGVLSPGKKPEYLS